MKRFILASLILLISSSVLFSKDEGGPKQIWDFGITAATAIQDVGSSYSGNINPIGTSSGIFSTMWIGGILHIMPSIAVRPAFMISRLKGEDTDVLGASIDGAYKELTYGVSLDLLYYIQVVSKLFMYVGPSVKWDKWSYDLTLPGGDTEDYDRNYFDLSVLFGAQFMLSDYFGFFADIGIGFRKFTETQIDTDAAGVKINDFKNTFTQINSRSAYLGAVFYLK